MNSRIFDGAVQHHRLDPVEHRFAYPVSFLGIDLAELPLLDGQVKGFGHNRVRPVAIHDRDYFDGAARPLAESCREQVRRAGGNADAARVVLLTAARYWHYVFNPVSFYLGLAADNALRWAVAEVNNTFGDRHLYVLPLLEAGAGGDYRAQLAKAFHVSPFHDMRGVYAFSFRYTPDDVDVRVDLVRDGQPVFRSRLHGRGRPLTTANLVRDLVRHPLAGALTTPRIAAQAARLKFRRKLPVHARPEPASAMTIVRRPLQGVDKLARDTVFGLLQRLRHGELVLTLPDGAETRFGRADSGASVALHVRRWSFFRRVMLGGDVGFGEAYVDGDVDSPAITDVVALLIANRAELADGNVATALVSRLAESLRHLTRANTRRRSRHNIHAHYDLSNDFFQTFLDPTLMYSCAMFASPEESLDAAQQRKIATLITKLRLEPHHHLLEIGSGWGGFAIAAARASGCRVTSITVSEEQRRLAIARVALAGLSDRVEILFCDYREIRGQYDRLVSIEMLEAVGHPFLGAYFRACDRALKPDGLAVLQVITIPDPRYDAYRRGCDWIQKYVFPGGHLPALKAMTAAMARHSSLCIEHLENIGPHYGPTLRAWSRAFEQNLDRVRALGFDERFVRQWRYYLAYCEAGFASRTLDVLQLVLTRPNNPALVRRDAVAAAAMPRRGGP